MHSDNTLLTARELADRLRVQEQTVRRWANAGLVPVIRLPRCGLRFDYAKVRGALQEMPAAIDVRRGGGAGHAA